VTDPAFLVLASLADGDKHGYAMMEDIARFAGVRLGPGTLYGAITRLVSTFPGGRIASPARAANIWKSRWPA
jgi:hypothetical protein